MEGRFFLQFDGLSKPHDGKSFGIYCGTLNSLNFFDC